MTSRRNRRARHRRSKERRRAQRAREVGELVCAMHGPFTLPVRFVPLDEFWPRLVGLRRTVGRG